VYLFKNIIGNENNILSLTSAVLNNKIFHAYIFHGDEGVGKFLMAQCFAKMILCEKKNSCCMCYSCLAFDSSNHPDVIYISPSKTKIISIDDIREKIHTEIKPYVCDKKIFILRDELSVAAQNAILKILEEPEYYVVFIIIINKLEFLLETVLSRCVIIKINQIEINKLEDYLIKNNISHEHAKIYSRYAHGNIGRALSFAQDKNFFEMREKILDCMTKLSRVNLAEILNFVNILEEYKEKIDLILEIIYNWYADLIYYKQNKFINFNLDKLEEIKKNNRDIKKIYRDLKCVEQTRKFLRYNSNFKLSLSAMMIDLFLD